MRERHVPTPGRPGDPRLIEQGKELFEKGVPDRGITSSSPTRSTSRALHGSDTALSVSRTKHCVRRKENKGGAGGIIGTMDVVRAAPDGHTLVMATPSITRANPAINPNAGYDPVTDFTPVIIVAAEPTMLAVRSGFPVTNYQQFISGVRKNPGKYSYASPGVGGILHLQMRYFKALTGTSIMHVPFRGAGPAEVAVTSGQVDNARGRFTIDAPICENWQARPHRRDRIFAREGSAERPHVR